MSPQYWVFFWNFESEKFSGETKNFQAKIKIGQAELMNGQVFKSTFRTLILLLSFSKFLGEGGEGDWCSALGV